MIPNPNPEDSTCKGPRNKSAKTHSVIECNFMQLGKHGSGFPSTTLSCSLSLFFLLVSATSQVRLCFGHFPSYLRRFVFSISLSSEGSNTGVIGSFEYRILPFHLRSQGFSLFSKEACQID